MSKLETSTQSRVGTGQASRRQHTPHQILGPYFPARERPLRTTDLARAGTGRAQAEGEIIEIRGRVLDRDGMEVSGAHMTVWQANAFGRYAHPNDTNPAPLDPNFLGFAEVIAGHDGGYTIWTVKPGAYPAAGGRTRPPHIHFEVQGKFDRLITQMYFPGEPLNVSDSLLQSANNPGLLIAKPLVAESPSGHRIFQFDVVLMRG